MKKSFIASLLFVFAFAMAMPTLKAADVVRATTVMVSDKDDDDPKKAETKTECTKAKTECTKTKAECDKAKAECDKTAEKKSCCSKKK